MRWRFVLVLGGLGIAFVAVLAGLHVAARRQLETQRQQLRQEDARQLGRWLEIADRPMQELLLDLAADPETRAAFVRPDPEWLRANVNAALADRNFDAVWLVRTDGRLVHLAQRDRAAVPPPLPGGDRLAAAERAGRRLNFFAPEGDALWQFRAAPVGAGDESGGWIIVGRRWTEAWLQHLGGLAEAQARLEAPTVAFDEPRGAPQLHARRMLADLDGRTIRQLVLERPWPAEADDAASPWPVALLFVAFGAALLVAVGLAVRHWVLAPLALIGDSLRHRDPAAIAPCSAARTSSPRSRSWSRPPTPTATPSRSKSRSASAPRWRCARARRTSATRSSCARGSRATCTTTSSSRSTPRGSGWRRCAAS
ncbi:CHASE4 domain-containing protein [Oleiharenicola sp. Vm1]|uniref:CHASE4 domain-containing protein n=1 Tax=Oleiharenicola sp. Vm1 TaxID=3398393 RepID=UPI0039F447DB